MTRGRRARGALALAAVGAALLLLLVLHAGGGTGPPLYDGVCLPPHYLVLGGSPAPSSASATYTADQLNQTQELVTGEATPQAQLIVAANSFAVPAGTTVQVTISPVKPPSVAPNGGGIVGNAYQVSARSSTGQALDLTPGHPATVVLALPSSGGPDVTLERFDGSAWTALKTFGNGCGDTDEAASPSLGVFALVVAGSGPTGSGGGGGDGGGGTSPGAPVALIVVVVIAVLLAVLIGATRLARRRR